MTRDELTPRSHEEGETLYYWQDTITQVLDPKLMVAVTAQMRVPQVVINETQIGDPQTPEHNPIYDVQVPQRLISPLDRILEDPDLQFLTELSRLDPHANLPAGRQLWSQRIGRLLSQRGGLLEGLSPNLLTSYSLLAQIKHLQYTIADLNRMSLSRQAYYPPFKDIEPIALPKTRAILQEWQRSTPAVPEAEVMNKVSQHVAGITLKGLRR